MKYLWIICCLVLVGCHEATIPQASFKIAANERVADKQGWYHFTGFDFKGRLSGGNPHGKGRCRAPKYERSSQMEETACEFDNGARIDQHYLETTGQRIASNEEDRKEEARENARQAEINRAAERERERESSRATAAAFAEFQQNLKKAGDSLAEQDRQTRLAYDQAMQQKRAQLDQQRDEQRAKAQADADRRAQENARRQQSYAIRSPDPTPTATPYSSGSAQSQQPSRKELQAQLAAKQQAQNRQEEEMQRQALQQAKEKLQRSKQPQQVADNTVTDTPSSKKKVKYGPEQLEGIALCWQSQKHKDIWWCDGPIQFTELGESLEAQLGYVGCKPYRATAGSQQITLRSGTTVTAMVYLCGYGLWTDADVAKKYGISPQRNKYQCVNGPKDHCKENYQMTN